MNITNALSAHAVMHAGIANYGFPLKYWLIPIIIPRVFRLLNGEKIIQCIHGVHHVQEIFQNAIVALTKASEMKLDTYSHTQIMPC